MRYSEFEVVMSANRMNRYLTACGNDTKKAMTLYRLNFKLSQELFTVMGCFEIALRNAINNHCVTILGNDWLRNGVAHNGIFNNDNCRLTANNINSCIQKLGQSYTHNKLVAELGFGFWRYMFAAHQYLATGRMLLRIFPAKPVSTPALQYNNVFVFNQLSQINELRNRIAHHEPICFQFGRSLKDTTYIRQQYGAIRQLFQWMSIDESALLYGLDHINFVCNRIADL